MEHLSKDVQSSRDLTRIDIPDATHLHVSVDTYPGRIAARAYAYALVGINPTEVARARAILDKVGREG